MPNPEEALKLARCGSVDLVIGALGSAGYDGPALCQQLAELHAPPLSLLITEHGTTRDFEQGLCAGATKVIACPCRNGMLAARILTLLGAESRATPPGKRPLGKSAPQPGRPARLTSSLLAQLSRQAAEYWLSARSFFLTPNYEQTAEITFL